MWTRSWPRWGTEERRVDSGPRRVLILGGGFAAFRFARDLRHSSYRLLLAAPRNHFLFTPLLPSTTVGTLEFRSILEPFRRNLPGVELHLFEATGLDLGRKIVAGRSPLDGREAELAFDDLIIAVGAVPGTFGVPGVKEHALFLKEISDARRIRRAVLDCLERASWPGTTPERRREILSLVVVGGGPTGVEFAAELHDFLHRDLARAYPAEIEAVRITLLEGGPHLLGAYHQALSEYTARRFQREHIEVRTHTHVTGVADGRVTLQDGSTVAFGLLVWATGNAPSAFVAGLPFAKDHAGRLVVDPTLGVAEGVYALGDCSCLASQPVPATAQVAEQQGHYLADAFRRRARGRPVKPFRYHPMGMLAYVGGHRAVADLPQFQGRGRLAFLFWRSVYLTKVVSLRNKILVLFDWAKTRVFGRDLSRV